MKNILVIGTLSTTPGEDSALEKMRAYVDEAVRSERPDGDDVRTYCCHIDQFGYVANNETTEIHDLHNGKLLADYDLVFFRGKFQPAINDAALISYFLERKGIPARNSAYANRRAAGKIPQMFQMHDQGMPIPSTVTAPAADMPKMIRGRLDYPIVLKDVYGAHGNNNFLVEDEAELTRLLAEHQGIRFIAQEYIPNDADFRVLIVGDRELIIKRQAAGDSHLNNTSQGGSATLVPSADFPAEVIAESRRYAQSCNYEIAGVDVMFDKHTGNHYYLEINSQPQIANGAFVNEKQALVGAYFREQLDL